MYKNISSRGVAVFPPSKPSVPGTKEHMFDAIPHLMGWGFARRDLGGTELLKDLEVEPNFYCHPSRQGNPSCTFFKEHDIYSLSVDLLEIGAWKTISKLFSKQIERATEIEELPPKDTIQKWLVDIARTDLAQEMGSSYAGAVLACLSGDFGVEGDDDDEHKTGLSIAFRKKVVDVISVGIRL